MTTSALATVVRVTASMKHVNIVQNIAPETMPGQPAARTAAQAPPRRVTTRMPVIESAAKKLRQNVTSQLSACSSRRVTTSGGAPEDARADHPCRGTPMSHCFIASS